MHGVRVRACARTHLHEEQRDAGEEGAAERKGEERGVREPLDDGESEQPPRERRAEAERPRGGHVAGVGPQHLRMHAPRTCRTQ